MSLPVMSQISIQTEHDARTNRHPIDLRFDVLRANDKGNAAAASDMDDRKRASRRSA